MGIPKYLEKKIKSIGLKFGYSKDLVILGLSKKKQIEILNHLEKLNSKDLVKILEYD